MWPITIILLLHEYPDPDDLSSPMAGLIKGGRSPICTRHLQLVRRWGKTTWRVSLLPLSCSVRLNWSQGKINYSADVIWWIWIRNAVYKYYLYFHSLCLVQFPLISNFAVNHFFWFKSIYKYSFFFFNPFFLFRLISDLFLLFFFIYSNSTL